MGYCEFYSCSRAEPGQLLSSLQIKFSLTDFRVSKSKIRKKNKTKNEQTNKLNHLCLSLVKKKSNPSKGSAQRG